MKKIVFLIAAMCAFTFAKSQDAGRNWVDQAVEPCNPVLEQIDIYLSGGGVNAAWLYGGNPGMVCMHGTGSPASPRIGASTTVYLTMDNELFDIYIANSEAVATTSLDFVANLITEEGALQFIIPAASIIFNSETGSRILVSGTFQ